MLPLIGLLIGLIIGLFVSFPLPASLSPYLAILLLSGIDTILSVFNETHEKQEVSLSFLFHFFTNTVIAVLLTALGKQINFELVNIIAFVFTYRIFRNFTDLMTTFYNYLKNIREERRGRINSIKDKEADNLKK